MKTVALRLWGDEASLILSAELVLILTLVVLGVVVSLNSVAMAVNNELNDLSGAFEALDQSYFYNGLSSWRHAGVGSSGYADRQDLCDCSLLWTTGTNVHGGYYGRGYESMTFAPAIMDERPLLDDPCPGDDPCPKLSAPCDGCDVKDAPLKPMPNEKKKTIKDQG